MNSEVFLFDVSIDLNEWTEVIQQTLNMTEFAKTQKNPKFYFDECKMSNNTKLSIYSL